MHPHYEYPSLAEWWVSRWQPALLRRTWKRASKTLSSTLKNHGCLCTEERGRQLGRHGTGAEKAERARVQSHALTATMSAAPHADDAYSSEEEDGAASLGPGVSDAMRTFPLSFASQNNDAHAEHCACPYSLRVCN